VGKWKCNKILIHSSEGKRQTLRKMCMLSIGIVGQASMRADALPAKSLWSLSRFGRCCNYATSIDVGCTRG
jgi:hypothetical protein